MMENIKQETKYMGNEQEKKLIIIKMAKLKKYLNIKIEKE